jgi:hypothetical protein
MSIILDKKDTKNALNGVKSSKFPTKSNLTNGSNKNRDKIEKSTASKLHKTIAQILDL